MLRLLILTVLCFTLPTLVGCEQITGSGLVQVIGEVRMDRKPLADTMVAFIPLEFRNSSGTIREIAFGKTDNAGRFELRTSDAKGISPTDYRVLFFRSDSVKDEEENAIDRSSEEEETIVAKWMQNVLQRTDLQSRPAMEVSELKFGDIPAAYNIESTLRYKVKLGAGILYPKFNLSSHPEI